MRRIPKEDFTVNPGLKSGDYVLFKTTDDVEPTMWDLFKILVIYEVNGLIMARISSVHGKRFPRSVPLTMLRKVEKEALCQ